MEDDLSFDAGWHANIGETAAVMVIDEELVDLSETSFDDPDLPEDIENPAALLDHILIGKGAYYRVSETGVWGDPSEGTAELGEEYFDTITYAVAELINTFQDVRDDIYQRDRPSRAQESW